ncbi:MAG TPA: NUDIX domain-containing protein [Methanocella sp.]|nr:NUDIX domain-containing protein [Methanocella sp.]
MADRFIVGCGAVVAGKDGKLLMVRQEVGYWAGKWIFPGGKLEVGETLEAAARREVLEETGCSFATVRQAGAYVSYDPHTSFEKQVVLVYYLGRHTGGRPVVGEGVTDVGWFAPGEIEAMAARGEVPALLLKVLDDALDRK